MAKAPTLAAIFCLHTACTLAGGLRQSKPAAKMRLGEAIDAAATDDFAALHLV